MSKIRTMVLALVVLLAGLLGATACSTSAVAAVGPVVFFTPHQDDEALFMGAAIVEHVRLTGRTVYVVLLTDGGSSVVCAAYYPSRAACVAERDREFIAGVTAMGAIPVIPGGRAIDGKLTAQYANWIMSGYYYVYPGVSLKTMSEYDVHPDHAAAGRGLRQVGYVDSRWYVKPSEWATTPKPVGVIVYQDLRAVFQAYQPVGWLSAGEVFQANLPLTRDGYYR